MPLDFLDCSPGRGSPRDRFFARPREVLRALFPDAAHGADDDAGSAEGPGRVADGEGTALEPCLQPRYELRGRGLPEALGRRRGLACGRFSQRETSEISIERLGES